MTTGNDERSYQMAAAWATKAALDVAVARGVNDQAEGYWSYIIEEAVKIASTKEHVANRLKSVAPIANASPEPAAEGEAAQDWSVPAAQDGGVTSDGPSALSLIEELKTTYGTRILLTLRKVCAEQGAEPPLSLEEKDLSHLPLRIAKLAQVVCEAEMQPKETV